MATKQCPKCGEVKDEGWFGKKQWWCKTCAAEYRKANREKINASDAKYREANREKAKVRAAEYRKANREKIRAREAKYREANREKISARHAEYHKANREKISARHAEYRDALAPYYVARALSIPVTNLTPDLLALKREQLKLERALRKLKKELQS